METTDFSKILMILALLGVYFIISFMMKWIAGDFSPISIEEVSRDEVNLTDSNGVVTGKKLLVNYKYTYRDNNVKYKTKKITI